MVALAGLTVALSGLTASAGGLTGLFSSLGGIIGGVGSAIMSFIGPAIDWLREQFASFKAWWNENIMPIWDAFYAVAEPLITLIATFLSATLGTAFDIILIAWNVLVAALEVAWNLIVQPLIDIFVGLFMAGMALARGDWEGVMDAMAGIWDAVIMPVVQPFIDLFKVGMALAKGDWDAVMSGMKDVWNNSLGILINPLVEAIFGGLGSISDRWDSVMTALGNAWDAYIVTPIMWFFGPLIEQIEFIYENWDYFMLYMAKAWEDNIEPIWEATKLVAKIIFSPFIDAWNLLVDGMSWAYDNIIEPIFDGILWLCGEIWDILEPIIDGFADILSAGGDLIGSAIGGAGDLLGFSEGGVASGPSSGYPVMLHGTEAVVPLSGGRSIPVEMKGGGGGGGNTFNISINPSGITDRTDKRELARSMGNMIQQEVSRALGGTTMRGRM